MVERLNPEFKNASAFMTKKKEFPKAGIVNASLFFERDVNGQMKVVDKFVKNEKEVILIDLVNEKASDYSETARAYKSALENFQGVLPKIVFTSRKSPQALETLKKVFAEAPNTPTSSSFLKKVAFGTLATAAAVAAAYLFQNEDALNTIKNTLKKALPGSLLVLLPNRK